MLLPWLTMSSTPGPCHDAISLRSPSSSSLFRFLLNAKSSNAAASSTGPNCNSWAVSSARQNRNTASVSNNPAANAFAAAGDASSSTPSITDAVQQPPNTKTYQSSVYHFSLYYPNDLSVKEEPGASGSIVILFEDQATVQGFDIFITPYDQPHKSRRRPFSRTSPPGSCSRRRTSPSTARRPPSSSAPMKQWAHRARYGSSTAVFSTKSPLRNRSNSWLLQIMETWQFT